MVISVQSVNLPTKLSECTYFARSRHNPAWAVFLASYDDDISWRRRVFGGAIVYWRCLVANRANFDAFPHEVI